MSELTTRCGYVAFIGKPNAGKSTLLNRLLGFKLSITSRKPQTTRHRILGVKTAADTQMVFLDTPGLQQSTEQAINRYMNRVALSVLRDADVLVMLVDCQNWQSQDQWILQRLEQQSVPVILALNKIDKLNGRDQLLPLIESLSQQFKFVHIVPIAAKHGDQVDVLEQRIIECLPSSPFYFPAEQTTDRSEQFITAEFIREKLMRVLGKELPYALTVTIEAFSQEASIVRVAAIIWVNKASQKSIIIGKGGERLKKVGTAARMDMQRFFDKKVFVQLWVKVKTGWADNETALRQLGYDE